MKRLLLSFAISLSLSANGQKVLPIVLPNGSIINFSPLSDISITTTSNSTFTLSTKPMLLPTLDTIPVILLIADTSHRIETYIQWQLCVEVGCKDTTLQHIDTATHTKWIVEDRGNGGRGNCRWVYGYEVVSTGWVHHIKYLNNNYKPLPEALIVWMAVKRKL